MQIPTEEQRFACSYKRCAQMLLHSPHTGHVERWTSTGLDMKGYLPELFLRDHAGEEDFELNLILHTCANAADYRFTVVVLTSQRLPMLLSKTTITHGQRLRLSRLIGSCQEQHELVLVELKQSIQSLAIGLYVSQVASLNLQGDVRMDAPAPPESTPCRAQCSAIDRILGTGQNPFMGG